MKARSSSTRSRSGDCPAGYVCFGQQANITAPTTSPADPLHLVFLFHPSSLPGGAKPDDVVMFHDDVLVPRCTASSGVADPDPCILSVTKVKGRIEVEVLSSENGSWKGGRCRRQLEHASPRDRAADSEA